MGIVDFLKSFDAKETMAIIAAVLTMLTLVKGVVEYTKAQKWKKAEFLASEIKELFNDQHLARAFKMLDWKETTIPLFRDELANKEKVELKYHKRMLTHALRDPDVMGFSKGDEFIRDLMDDLFFRLSIFQNYIETGLIKGADLEPYLKYYISLIGDPRKECEGVQAAIRHYLNSYGFEDVINLCRKFGYEM